MTAEDIERISNGILNMLKNWPSFEQCCVKKEPSTEDLKRIEKLKEALK